jgi:cancer susceptibility candidate protein 1
MGKKKGKKKSKEELEAERLAREEEERIAAELEAKRLEEERIAAEKAYKERQEELTRLRSEELARLRTEQDDSSQGLAQFTRRLSEVEAQSQANGEWKRYVNCTRMPNPLSETELNTFVAEWVEDGVFDLEETLSTCIETETVASDITSYASTARGRGEAQRAENFDQYANKLRDAQLKKIDYTTASLLNNAAQYTNEKNECKISSNAGSLKFGVWINVALKPFRLKVVDFGKTGIVVDIPKPLALHSVAVRVLYHPANHVAGGAASGIEAPVGGVLHMDLLQMPPQERNVKGWVMRQVTTLSNDVGRMLYPPGSSHDSGASSNAPPLRVKCVVPPNVVVPSELKMGWWNAGERRWMEDGVSDANFDAESRLLSFHTTQLQSIAMIQPRHLDLPVAKWSIRPTGPSCATFSITGSRFKLDIDIDGENCTLRSPDRSEFAHLLGVAFTGPGELFQALKACGINMCPINEDASNCSLPSNPGEPIVPKDESLESLVEQDACTLANAFCISGSIWNQKEGSQSCVFRIQEAEIDEFASTGNGEEEEKESGAEWKTVLYTMDCKLDELEVEVTEPTLLSSVKCVLVKGGEDADTFNSVPEPAAETHAYLKYCLAGKCTPDALDNMSTATPLFTQTVRSILHTCRVFSFA